MERGPNRGRVRQTGAGGARLEYNRPRHLEDRQQPQPQDGELPGRHVLSVSQIAGRANSTLADVRKSAEEFTRFLAKVRKAFKREIPLRQRDDWEE